MKALLELFKQVQQDEEFDAINRSLKQNHNSLANSTVESLSPRTHLIKLERVVFGNHYPFERALRVDITNCRTPVLHKFYHQYLDDELSAVFVREVANRYTLTRRVEVISSDLLQITFTLSWRNYDGRTLSRAMTTYYAHYGIHDYFYNHSS